jgi:dihydroflavonol-4-reductase
MRCVAAGSSMVCPRLSLATVDVREVVLAHIRAAENSAASGRYIVAGKQTISFVEISRIIRKVHRRPYLLPRHEVPDLLVKAVGPFFGLSQRYIRNRLGIGFKVDNRRSIDELGIVYRPVEETLVDHYNSWVKQKG